MKQGQESIGDARCGEGDNEMHGKVWRQGKGASHGEEARRGEKANQGKGGKAMQGKT